MPPLIFEPTRPKPLAVLALSVTCVKSTPRVRLMRFRISGMKGESFGVSATIVISMLATLNPLALSNWLVWPSRTRLEMSLYPSSPEGNKVPISPRSAAPHKASIMEWIATSASLQPDRPLSWGMSTPPKTNLRPETSRWLSQPVPTLNSSVSILLRSCVPAPDPQAWLPLCFHNCPCRALPCIPSAQQPRNHR
jgi:hypothetical protein